MRIGLAAHAPVENLYTLPMQSQGETKTGFGEWGLLLPPAWPTSRLRVSCPERAICRAIVCVRYREEMVFHLPSDLGRRRPQSGNRLDHARRNQPLSPIELAISARRLLSTNRLVAVPP